MSKEQKDLRHEKEKCQNHEQIKQLKKSRMKILKQNESQNQTYKRETCRRPREIENAK